MADNESGAMSAIVAIIAIIAILAIGYVVLQMLPVEESTGNTTIDVNLPDRGYQQ